QSSSQFAIKIYEGLNNISESDLTWREPLANQVLSDESNLIQNLSGSAKNSFMRPSHKMCVQLPSNIQDMCTDFVKNFYDGDMEANVTDDILNSLCKIWRNLAFDEEFANAQSERTYVTDVIVPLIRSSLRKLPIKKYAFLST
ncbi:8803_t:CDS:2, partial [Diversispora eburnea]